MQTFHLRFSIIIMNNQVEILKWFVYISLIGFMPIDPWEFQGLKKADQQTILDDFNKHGTGIKQPSTVPPVVVPAAPTASTHTPTNSMVSREDVLTRAAALGRGAATTGFKRFLALTEAAKDRKDGPFRKLFNPWFIDNDAYITGKCFFVFLCSFLQVKKKKKTVGH